MFNIVSIAIILVFGFVYSPVGSGSDLFENVRFQHLGLVNQVEQNDNEMVDLSLNLDLPEKISYPKSLDHFITSLKVDSLQSNEVRVNNRAAKKLAFLSYHFMKDSKRRGNCLWGVARTLDRFAKKDHNLYQLPNDNENVKKFYGSGHSAANFLKWADANPRSLCENLGFKRVKNMKKGYIALYDKGRCGFSKKYGHIEFVVNSDTACSDHCRQINPECVPDLVLAPVTTCEEMISTKLDTFENFSNHS